MKKIEKDTLKFSGIDNLEMIQGVPQQGETGGTPATFKPNTAPEIKEMTVDDIISTIDGVPYYNDVVGDLKNGDESWEVTKKVKEYANYMKANTDSLRNLPPIIVIDGKLQDGAHRISAVYLLQELLDPTNTFWKNLKLKVNFYQGTDKIGKISK